MFTSALIKKAWEIRRKAAKTMSCKVLEVSWKCCLNLAKSLNLKAVNNAMVSVKHFDNITEVIRFCNEKKVSPVLKKINHKGVEIIANYFDAIMILSGSKKRVRIV